MDNTSFEQFFMISKKFNNFLKKTDISQNNFLIE